MMKKDRTFTRVLFAVLLLFSVASSAYALDEQLTVQQVAESIVKPDMNDFDKSMVIQALEKVPAEKLTTKFKNVLLSLITEDMNGVSCFTIIDVLSQLSENKWDDFISFVLSFMLIDMDGHTRSGVIGSLGKVPYDQWETFKTVAYYFILPEMTGSDRAYIVDALSQITVEKVSEPFKRIALSLMKDDTNGLSRSKILHALADVSSEKLTDEFEKNIHSLITSDMSADDRANVIRSFGKIPVQKWNKFKAIFSALVLPNITASQLARLINALGTTPPEKITHKFKKFALSIIPATMDIENRAQIIFALAAILKENITEDFKAIVDSEVTDDMNGIQRGIIIRTFGKLRAEKWQELKRLAGSLFSLNMNGKHRANIYGYFGDLSDSAWGPYTKNGLLLISNDMNDDDRFTTLQALMKTPNELWDEFTSTALALMTKEMNGKNRMVVTKALGDIWPFQRQQVYSQVKRFTDNVKFQFTNPHVSTFFIKTLARFEPIERAQVFTTGLIRHVETDTVEVDNSRLLNHIHTMTERVKGIAQSDLTDLAYDDQSLHRKEVHESVAVSLERLKVRYPSALLLSNGIYDQIFDELAGLIPEDPDRVSTATRLFKDTYTSPEVHGQLEILLAMNPYTRSGVGDADTLLNESMEGFLEPHKKRTDEESKKFVKDVRHLVGLYTHQYDLEDTVDILEIMESTPNYRDPLSLFNYREMLCLVYHAMTDPSSGMLSTPLSSDDIKQRWANFIYRLGQAHHEYGDEASCLSGFFNAPLDALNKVHPDVVIIHSFSTMMQEIGGEGDDETFEKRVSLILSHIGPHAQEDSYYQDIIKAYRSARAARNEEEET